MIEQARGPAARGAGAAATRASRRACDVDAGRSPAAARLTAAAAPSLRIDALATVDSVALETLGTRIESNAPLMSAGLDSLAAAAFVSALAARLSVDIAPTELFDHPTLSSIASFASTHAAMDDDDGPRRPADRQGVRRRLQGGDDEVDDMEIEGSQDSQGSQGSQGSQADEEEPGADDDQGDLAANMSAAPTRGQSNDFPSDAYNGGHGGVDTSNIGQQQNARRNLLEQQQN